MQLLRQDTAQPLRLPVLGVGSAGQVLRGPGLGTYQLDDGGIPNRQPQQIRVGVRGEEEIQVGWKVLLGELLYFRQYLLTRY